MAEAKQAPAEAKKKKGGKSGLILIFILFILAAPFLMPTLTLIMVGMLPTFVALLTDTDPHKSSTSAVGSMNFAGLTPFIIDLWTKGQTMETTFSLLRDGGNWLMILGAAAVGQLIVFAVPQAMASLTFIRAENRIKLLRQNLEQLKTSWGPDVATTKPVDRIGRS